MATEKLKIIKEAHLTNNCPECFNQDLNLTFYQKHTYNSFFHKTTAELSHTLVCNKCQCTIYPVKWTDDIERMFDYSKKTAVPEKKSLKPTSLFYVILLLIIALIAGGTYLFMEGIITF